MAARQEYEKIYIASIILAVIILAANLYYYCHPVLRTVGLTASSLDYLAQMLRHGGVFSTPLKTKGVVLILMLLCTIVRSGKGAKVEPAVLASVGLVSLALYLIPFGNPLVYLIATLAGSFGLLWTFSMLSRLFSGFHEHDNDLKESFEQESEPVENPWSINLPTKYYYHKRWHKGCISVVNPFRGTLVVGSAGAGKSFSVFNPFIEQMIGKGYTMMLYDYKMPDLTGVVYNALLRNKDKYPRPPQFYCINFKDPQRSNRCNPIAAEYLTDIIDASETARVVMEALNKGNEKKDFFWMSAQQYIGICLWLLRIYTPPGRKKGDWCDFPHLIELINQDYAKVLRIVKKSDDLDGKARVFVDALEANAQDQLQGQIASARIPLNDIASPLLYWVLSGNDFNLDINDPEAPKVLCIGNDPDRQQVYGAALSLFTFRVIKRVNRPGKLPCALPLDELPTISVQGLDGLMATARSNRVAVVLGIQDVSQITADYGEKTAEKILALPANVFVGASSLKTAEKYSKEFGREFRRQESQTRSVDSESVSISFHEEEIMPIRKITSLPQGSFIGKVAVDNTTPITQPFFCGAIQIDMDEYRKKAASEQPVPILTDFKLKELREKVFSPAQEPIYVKGHLREEVFREWNAEEDFAWTPDQLDNEVDKRYEAMSPEERLAILESMMPQLEKDYIQRRMEDNYAAIKGDIRELIDDECPEDEDCSNVNEYRDDMPSEDGEGSAPAAPRLPAPSGGSREGSADASKRIVTMGISAHTAEVLLDAGFAVVSDLEGLTGEEIASIEGLGSVGIREVLELMEKYGISAKNPSQGSEDNQS